MRWIRRRHPATYALALANAVFLAACTGKDCPSGSVAYYRTHPAEWERAVWVCTNDDSAFVSTIGCVNVLAVLNEASVGKARGGLPEASASSSSQSVARN